MTERQVDLLHELERLGKQRRELPQEIGVLAQQAIDAKIPIAHIAKAVGVTRQTIYTLTQRKESK